MLFAHLWPLPNFKILPKPKISFLPYFFLASYHGNFLIVPIMNLLHNILFFIIYLFSANYLFRKSEVNFFYIYITNYLKLLLKKSLVI
jgi:hypothetical protein